MSKAEDIVLFVLFGTIGSFFVIAAAVGILKAII